MPEWPCTQFGTSGLCRYCLHNYRVKTALHCCCKATGWSPSPPNDWPEPARLVLAFGGYTFLRDERLLADVRHAYPSEQRFGCSSVGEISGTQVTDDIMTNTVLTEE